MKKKILPFLIAISAVFALFFVKTQSANAATTVNSNNPVFFVPGAFDTEESWQKTISKIDPNSEHTVVKFSANPYGQILRQNVRTVNNGERPYVVVTFPVNAYHEDVIAQDADALRDAISTYNLKNKFKEADIVAHSNGGSITTTYLEKNAGKAGFPFHFNTFMSVGTPYNFQAGNGAENTAFLNKLIAGSGQLPKDLNVINVIGSQPKDSTSDGVVSKDSAESGRKIFDGQVATFKQIHITGEDAIHGNQEGSDTVAALIAQVLNL
ncbi:alpha/beta hydrolase [Companilactobacillus ginsenosidimutans]|uniref:alpha/beta hydrolase n=1 Tax=Companilactobacillus ginsenosidimutans TaxID=1007676 RepID=UPI000661239B|nr:alpha/beta hydrolase [Companilactobacillus ginsenosidimutans]